jgi:cytidylate kinase
MIKLTRGEKMVVAIDGPAGSGKGTITKIVAEKLNLVYIDSGATYRCVSLACLRNNLKLEDKEKIIELAKTLDIRFDEKQRTFLNGEDVSKQIREKEVTGTVSQVSSIVEVREILVDLQRKMAIGKNVIMEGRDITTVVFPNADYKFYLDATVEERAKRRYLQNQEMGIESNMDEIIENIKFRDYNDMHKPVGSLMRTDDQIYIDSTNMTIDEVVNEIIKHIKKDMA